MAKKVEKVPTWGEIGELLMKIMINILSSAIGRIAPGTKKLVPRTKKKSNNHFAS